ncbi:vicilin-like seed storage protein At2g28490 [Mangifera indica]|uniref:vicilin-like seed storage protein At2g28490 n=1 Tax=Mangifera indica TaxID=29780 RepID=UPI001CFB52C6|nr:vicilin-like seed storage protein At2g28490 [Mangifera indica]
MRNLLTLLLLVLVFSYGLTLTIGYRDEDEDWKLEREWEREERGGDEDEDERLGRGEESFLLQDAKQVVKTEAGDVRVVRSIGGRIVDRPMHIGFISMEPKSLFIPQYIDSSLILFVRRGEARIGWVHKDELVEKTLKVGDLYRIRAGSAFYLMNTEEGQKLHIICSIDPSESLGLRAFQSFFIGGGSNPTSILAGFGHETLSNAFNVTADEVEDILNRQQEGPIVYISDSHAPSMWSKFLQLKEQERLHHLKRLAESQQEPQQEDPKTWSWRKLLNSVFRAEDRKETRATNGHKGAYNIYNRRPHFKNNYGWSIALDESDYKPLKHSGIGVYLVNLTAGSMMAPHVNPTATEYGVVLRGMGRIQIVYPNGSSALDAKVKEGDVFWVPRYFAFCQIALTGPFEFFGFTTSARKNRPQFLVGASSLLRTLPNPELAASFGVSEDRIKQFTNAQREAVILPTAAAAAPEKTDKYENKMAGKFEKVPHVIRSFGNDLILGFD